MSNLSEQIRAFLQDPDRPFALVQQQFGISGFPSASVTGKHFGVSRATVAAVERKLASHGVKLPDQRINADGKTIRIGNIGRPPDIERSVAKLCDRFGTLNVAKLAAARLSESEQEILRRWLDGVEAESQPPKRYRYLDLVELDDAAFASETGVSRTLFAQMVLAAHKQGDLRSNKLSLEDQILLTICYLRDRPTHAQLGEAWGIHWTTTHRLIDQVEPLLAPWRSALTPD